MVTFYLSCMESDAVASLSRFGGLKDAMWLCMFSYRLLFARSEVRVSSYNYAMVVPTFIITC